MKLQLMAAGAIAAMGLVGSAAPAAADPIPMGKIECDRACLQDMVDQYLAAVVAHDPAGCRWRRTSATPRTARS